MRSIGVYVDAFAPSHLQHHQRQIYTLNYARRNKIKKTKTVNRSSSGGGFGRGPKKEQPVLEYLDHNPSDIVPEATTDTAAQLVIVNDPKLYKTQPLVTSESSSWAFEQNLDSVHAFTHSLFQEVACHLRSNTDENGSRAKCMPFLMKADDAAATDGGVFNKVPIIEFTDDNLESAIASDYLDACTERSQATSNTSANGSNEHQAKGWRMEGLDVNQNNERYNSSEHSFQSKRVSYTSILSAQNTVVLNSAGAHVSSQLAPTSLAALHGLKGTTTGVCLNLYVTKSNIFQSAPPHTDKQDVVVVQTQGRKRWRVYTPPDCECKMNADAFCRGKGDDELTVDMLVVEGSELLLDVTLEPGDILFVPVRFPHTTDTLNCYDDEKNSGRGDNNGCKERKSSIHMTIGLDTHVWAQNYMSMRTLALRRFGIHNVLKSIDFKSDPDRDMDKCIGRANQLSVDLREGLFSSIVSGADNCDETSPLEQNRILATNLLSFHKRVDVECGWVGLEDNSLTLEMCLETVIQFQYIGQKIKTSHEDMYMAALEEERMRNAGAVDWTTRVGDAMEKEISDRLSIFRVPVYFEQLDKHREELRAWGDRQGDEQVELPMLLEGDQVEADLLGIGAFGSDCAGTKSVWPSAKIIKVRPDGLLNLQLFDGTVRAGVQRRDIKGPHGLGIFL